MLKSIVLFSLASGLGNFINTTPVINSIPNPIDNKNSVTISQKKPEQKTYPTLEREGFLFQFKGCKSTADNIIICNLVVTNKQQKRDIQLCPGNTKIIDGAGNELIASEASLGSSKSNGGCVGNVLSTNIPLKASVTFRGAIGSNIILFDLSATNSYKGYFNVEFKQQ